MPLQSRPVLRQTGRALHGRRSRIERYCLPDLWCLHVYAYEAEVQVDGRPFSIHPGSVGITPPGVLLEYTYRGPSLHHYAHFHFEAGAVAATAVPMMTHAGPAGAALGHAMAEVSQGFPRNPRRAEVLLWDILWRVAESHESAQTEGAAPAVVRRICEAIELHLVDRLDVRSLAERFGVSQNHLARLFKRHVGKTPARYIAGRRAHHAEHLLRRTTLPVKVVAGMVGFTDLHQFNKAIRRLLGRSPRAVRTGSSGRAD